MTVGRGTRSDPDRELDLALESKGLNDFFLRNLDKIPWEFPKESSLISLSKGDDIEFHMMSSDMCGEKWAERLCVV